MKQTVEFFIENQQQFFFQVLGADMDGETTEPLEGFGISELSEMSWRDLEEKWSLVNSVNSSVEIFTRDSAMW